MASKNFTIKPSVRCRLSVRCSIRILAGKIPFTNNRNSVEIFHGCRFSFDCNATSLKACLLTLIVKCRNRSKEIMSSRSKHGARRPVGKYAVLSLSVCILRGCINVAQKHLSTNSQ
jgi:hypothetical protein